MPNNNFPYLSDSDVYLDAACQSLRPQPVIDALNDYYTKYNSCGERVNYKWGKLTDQKLDETRSKVLKFFKLSKRQYFVSFTLNTTYGINLLLHQIHPRYVKKVITSDIEHNSVFLSTMSFAKTHKLKREVLKRNSDGSLPLNTNFNKALVVVNITSNFDGRVLKNLKALISKVHKSNGIIILDAAQAAAHHPELLYRTAADAICFSAHKMYSASLGVMIIRRDLVPQLRPTFLGGGMVDDVFKASYQLSSDNPDHVHTIFEPGLQAWGEIIAFGAALDWLNKIPKKAKKALESESQRLYDFLASRPKVHLVNTAASNTISFYIEGFSSDLIADALSDQNIMVRTGYFCVHYYLAHVQKYPHLVRCSLGYHTRPSDIDKLIAALDKVTK